MEKSFRVGEIVGVRRGWAERLSEVSKVTQPFKIVRIELGEHLCGSGMLCHVKDKDGNKSAFDSWWFRHLPKRKSPAKQRKGGKGGA